MRIKNCDRFGQDGKAGDGTSLPDRTFHNFRASTSGDQGIQELQARKLQVFEKVGRVAFKKYSYFASFDGSTFVELFPAVNPPKNRYRLSVPYSYVCRPEYVQINAGSIKAYIPIIFSSRNRVCLRIKQRTRKLCSGVQRVLKILGFSTSVMCMCTKEVLVV